MLSSYFETHLLRLFLVERYFRGDILKKHNKVLIRYK